jgi:hypothetical protein
MIIEENKINKECSSIYLIDENLCLSDSLKVLNINFFNLQTQLQVIFEYSEYFKEFYNLFTSNSSFYFDVLTNLNQFSALWDSSFETISRNYNKFSEIPIYLIFPALIEFNDWYGESNNSVKSKIISWLNLNFPATEYPLNQKLNISLNLTKNHDYMFNFQKSYYENCSMFQIKSEQCKPCRSVVKNCCNTEETCLNETSESNYNFINNNSTNINGIFTSNSTNLNYSNPNFNITNIAVLKANTIINGNLEVNGRIIPSGKVSNDIVLTPVLNPATGTLQLPYTLKSDIPKTISQNVSYVKQTSPARTTNILRYDKGNLEDTKELNINSGVPTKFEKTSNFNFSAGKYRIEYLKGAMSFWSEGNLWTPGRELIVKSGNNTLKFGTGDCCLGITQAEDRGKNFYGKGKPYYVEFDHNGGEITIFEPEIDGSVYTDNRKLNNIAPTFQLYKMVPVYVSGEGDGKYDLATISNPFNFPADLKLTGIVDNQLFLDGEPYTEYSETFSNVNVTLKNIPPNESVKMEVLTKQGNSLNADFAKFEGTIEWATTSDIPTQLGINGKIEWKSTCNPQYFGTSIQNCNACNNCDIDADNNSTTITCGKVSGDKTVNINYTKNIIDRSIYRTLYVSLINNQNNWNFI